MTEQQASKPGFFARVKAMWATELEVAWFWPQGRFHLLRRIAVHVVLDALVLWLIVRVVPGIGLDNLWSAGLVVIAAGTIYVTLRPVVFILVRGHDNLTLLVTLTIDTLTLLVVGALDIGLTVDSIIAALVTGFLLTTTHVVVGALLAIDEGETFYRNVTLRLIRKGEVAPETTVPGVVIIQIDGLSAPLLKTVVRTGQMPFVASWLRSGSHRLLDWECALPSMTSASQAGILHGNNFDIPAFRWYEKDKRRLMVSNNPRDAAEIESRVSGPNDLLAGGGTSISNLLSGGASRSIVTTSRLGSRSDRSESVTENLSSYLARPNTAFRLIAMTMFEVLKEWMQAWRQRRLGIDPRMHRGGVFPLLRASTTVVMPDLLTEIIIEEMERGTPIVYADILGYDEIAHHAGPERPDAVAELQDIDHCIRTLVRASERAPRPYRFVMLSDHGQSQGATFAERFGTSLQDLVKSFVGGDVDVMAEMDNAESWSTVNAMANQLAEESGAAGTVTNQLTKGRRDGDYVRFGPGTSHDEADQPGEDVVVTASGNLALIYLNASPERLTFEEIEEIHPGLVAGLAAHPGVSFVMVKSKRHGPIAMGPTGIHRLDDDVVDGGDPLTLFGPNIVAHLKRINTFPHVGDILVNSMFDPETEEVAPFEKLIGCHGGLGGPQTAPFLLVPHEWEPPDGPIVGSESLNGLLRNWIAAMGEG